MEMKFEAFWVLWKNSWDRQTWTIGNINLEAQNYESTILRLAE